jgi:hypothetical protein
VFVGQKRSSVDGAVPADPNILGRRNGCMRQPHRIYAVIGSKHQQIFSNSSCARARIAAYMIYAAQ